jgi:hypothetical protein
MVRLELSDEDAAALGLALESTLSDLRYEISSTDRQDFRDTLKRRKEALMRVLEQLSASRPMS